MKKLEEMGLVPLTKKECVEQNGGNECLFTLSALYSFE